MRRRGMRRLQSASMRWMSPARAERARLGLVRQNALARRIGLRLLRFVVLMVMACVTVELVASAALSLVQSGVLAPRRPEAP